MRRDCVAGPDPAEGWSASFIWACIGFMLGRFGGRAVLARGRVKQAHLDKVEQLFRRYGVLVVLLLRFVDGFRQLTPMTVAMTPLRL